MIMASTNKTKFVLLHASQLQLSRPRKKKDTTIEPKKK